MLLNVLDPASSLDEKNECKVEMRGHQEAAHSNQSPDRRLALPMRQKGNPDTVIDTSRLLFKPLTLPQLHTGASAAGSERGPAEWDLSDMLTVRLGVVIPQVQLQTSSVPADALSPHWGSHVSSTIIAPHGRPQMLTLARSKSHQSKHRPGSLKELVWYTLGAVAVVALYLLTPLVTTLIPIMPTDWSRVLIALEILGVAEFVIFRILMKTTQQQHDVAQSM